MHNYYERQFFFARLFTVVVFSISVLFCLMRVPEQEAWNGIGEWLLIEHAQPRLAGKTVWRDWG